jgi:hypothetical protein
MPESPELVVPDFIINWPLVPTFPAFEEIIDILPLLLDILCPVDTRCMDANIAPLVVEPYPVLTESAPTCVPSPVLNVILPEDPVEVVPEVKLNAPDTPLVPAFALTIIMVPLDDDNPFPTT